MSASGREADKEETLARRIMSPELHTSTDLIRCAKIFFVIRLRVPTFYIIFVNVELP